MIDGTFFIEQNEKVDYTTIVTSNTLFLVDKHFEGDSSVMVVLGKYCSYHLEDELESVPAQLQQRIVANREIVKRLSEREKIMVWEIK